MKTAVITGSSRGLGLEMAKCFRKCGMNVVLNGVSLDRLQKARQALESIPGNCRLYLYFAVAGVYFRTSFAYDCDA